MSERRTQNGQALGTAYWDGISPLYDSLYSGRWSALEDAKTHDTIQKLFEQISTDRPLKIVDLGCGTGLGFDLIDGQAPPESQLLGVDSSLGMLEKCQTRHPTAELRNSLIEDSIDDLPNQLDIVLILSVTGSYIRNLDLVLQRLRSHLATDSAVLLSILSRYSMRRLVRGKFTLHESYRTRGDRALTSEPPPRVRTYSMREIERLVSQSGYRTRSIHTGAPLAGVLEKAYLWQLSESIRRLAPSLGHNIEVVLSPSDTPDY